jgi:hypothetical protein
MSDEFGRERTTPSAPPGGSNAQEKKQAVAGSGEQVKQEAARTAREVRHQGEEIASTAIEQADQYATKQKEAGAEHVAHFARAMECAAGELEETSPELAGYARRAASSVDRFSNTLRERSVRELVDDTNDFARREPALFFAGAIVAGIALSRFLRSSEERQAHSYGQSQSSSYGQGSYAQNQGSRYSSDSRTASEAGVTGRF